MALALPTKPNFTRCRFGIVNNTQVFDSPISKTVQTFRLGGERWRAEYEYPPIDGKTHQRQIAAEWESLFAQMEGRAVRVTVAPPFRSRPRGAWGAMSPLVDGASQTGSTLNIKGLSAGVNNVAMVGDYCVVNTELKIVTANANSDGSGKAALSIKPRLRNSPSDSAAITVLNPTVDMIAVSDEAGWEVTAFGLYRFTLSCIEIWEASS